jgi:hypothetical protein
MNNYLDIKLYPNYRSYYDDKTIKLIENCKKLEKTQTNNTISENIRTQEKTQTNNTISENSKIIKTEQIYNFVYHYLKKIKLVKIVEEFEIENESENEYICEDDYFY